MRINFVIIISLIIPIALGNCKKKSATDNKDKTAQSERKSYSKTDSKSADSYVTAKGGLRMRDAASTKGKKAGLIPHGTKVEILETSGDDMTISSATGKWTKVKWGEKVGWVFGGFLGATKALDSMQAVFKAVNKIEVSDSKRYSMRFIVEIKEKAKAKPNYRMAQGMQERYGKVIETKTSEKAITIIATTELCDTLKQDEGMDCASGWYKANVNCSISINQIRKEFKGVGKPVKIITKCRVSKF